MKRQRHKRPSHALKTCHDSLQEVSNRANRLTAENEALTLALLVMGEMWRRDVGYCLRCGMILHCDPADIPAGWITQWHVDCDGLCAECALVSGFGDQERAQAIMAEVDDGMWDAVVRRDTKAAAG